MHIVHRDGAQISFDISKISEAISKAALRQEQEALEAQHSELLTMLYCLLTEDCSFQCGEERIWERIKEIRNAIQLIEETMKINWQMQRCKNNLDRCRIKNLVLDQLRKLSRSGAMRFATDMSLVTVPTPPTVVAASDSLNCGRIAYVGV